MSKLVEISDENHEAAKAAAKQYDLTLGRFMDHVLEFFFERQDKIEILRGFQESPEGDA
jgi:hypothetical protein